jgi:hypothetical protein
VLEGKGLGVFNKVAHLPADAAFGRENAPQFVEHWFLRCEVLIESRLDLVLLPYVVRRRTHNERNALAGQRAEELQRIPLMEDSVGLGVPPWGNLPPARDGLPV